MRYFLTWNISHLLPSSHSSTCLPVSLFALKGNREMNSFSMSISLPFCSAHYEVREQLERDAICIGNRLHNRSTHSLTRVVGTRQQYRIEWCWVWRKRLFWNYWLIGPSHISNISTMIHSLNLWRCYTYLTLDLPTKRVIKREKGRDTCRFESISSLLLSLSLSAFTNW